MMMDYAEDGLALAPVPACFNPLSPRHVHLSQAKEGGCDRFLHSCLFSHRERRPEGHFRRIKFALLAIQITKVVLNARRQPPMIDALSHRQSFLEMGLCLLCLASALRRDA